MELGVLSLGDLQRDPATGQRVSAATRTREIVSYGILADRLGLDVFALREHHSYEFAVSSPAVILAAARPVQPRLHRCGSESAVRRRARSGRAASACRWCWA